MFKISEINSSFSNEQAVDQKVSTIIIRRLDGQLVKYQTNGPNYGNTDWGLQKHTNQ